MLDISKAHKFLGQSFPFNAEVEIESMEVLDDPVSFSDVLVEGEFVGTGSMIGLKGNVTSTVTSRCARCLEDVSMVVKAEFDVQYSREADPEDPDLYLFEGSKLDLTDSVRDALLLNLPYRFLCSDDCKGLCSGCGKNLNLGPCTCQEGGENSNPFSALKAFLQNNEEV